jgi:hypothetical protein
MKYNNISGIQTPSSPVLYWGMGQPRATTFQANWNLMSLEIVPEPSTSWLIMLGGGVLIYLRRKCRR